MIPAPPSPSRPSSDERTISAGISIDSDGRVPEEGEESRTLMMTAGSRSRDRRGRTYVDWAAVFIVTAQEAMGFP